MPPEDISRTSTPTEVPLNEVKIEDEFKDTTSEYPRWWLQANVQGETLKCLYDPGAARTVMGPIALEIARKANIRIESYIGAGVRVANGSFAPIYNSIEFEFQLGTAKKRLEIIVMHNLNTDCLLGADFIRMFNIVLFPRKNTILAEGFEGEAPIEIDSVEIEDNNASGLSQPSKEEMAELHKLLDELLPADPEALGCTTICEHVIDVGDAKPIKQKCYPVSRKIEQEMHRQVDDLLAKGVIVPSSSAWASPVVMVKKPPHPESKEGGSSSENSEPQYRMCIDYRKINQVSRGDAFPVPNMESLLNRLEGARFLSTLDLSSAFHQIPVAKECRHITAFIVPGKGIYEWARMPFGLKNSTATFQRAISKVITPDMATNTLVYVDDVVIWSDTWSDHLKWLRLVITKLNEAGFTINRKKSFFGRKEVRYLGFLIDDRGIRTDPEKIRPIADYPIPKNLKQLRKFIGMCSWYRKFIRDFATICEPLNSLTRKDVPYIWSEECEEAFKTLKEKLTSSPILSRPKFDEQFILETDASQTGLGAVLLQRYDNSEKVIAYASRALTAQERKFSTTELEMLAILWAIRKHRCYVEGEKFLVVTDHHSLKYMLSLRNPCGRLARWTLELQQYDFTVEHKAGKCHVVPDTLSRIYEDNEEEICAIGANEEILDSWYKERLENVRNNPEKFRDWKIVNGLLYYYRPDPASAAFIEDEYDWKLVVPKENRSQILKECHNDPQSGHLARQKTLKRVSLRYFWPKMYRDVVKHVSSCYICQQCKPIQALPAGKMSKRVITQPWSIIAADCMGAFPRSKKGYQHLLIIEDLFTKYIEAIPIRQKLGKTIADILEKEILLRHGVCDFLVSDNGTEFLNKDTKSLCEKYGFTHSLVPLGHPASDPVERINKTYKTMIMSYISPDHRTWDEEIPKLTWAYNLAVHLTTGYSPFFLNYGRHPIGSSFRLQQERKSEETAQNEALEVRVDRIKSLNQIHKNVRDNQKEATEVQAKYYDKRHSESKFEIGDKVLLRNNVLSKTSENTSAGLTPRWRGDYILKSKISENIFEVIDDKGQPAGNWHTNDMIKRVMSESEKNEIEESEHSDSKLVPDEDSPRFEDSPGHPPKKGRPKKNKRGRPRKTILAPKALDSNFDNSVTPTRQVNNSNISHDRNLDSTENSRSFESVTSRKDTRGSVRESMTDKNLSVIDEVPENTRVTRSKTRKS